MSNKSTRTKPFHFKQFSVLQEQSTMKVGTDGILLGTWADVNGCSSILDIGTGTGVIAIMLAQRNTTAKIHAIEVDDKACKEAQVNMQSCPWKDRLEAIPMLIQHYAKEASQKYDLIVSNPPFFSGGTFSKNQDRNSVRHTIKLPHGDLLAAVRTLLKREGKFCVILPYLEGLRFQELARTYHLYCTKIVQVRPKAASGIERLLMQFERSQKILEKEELIIQKGEANDWTEDFIQLGSAFYLDMP